MIKLLLGGDCFMNKIYNRNIYMRFLLSALPILLIPVLLLFCAYFRNQYLYKQEIYSKNLSILENSALMAENMMNSAENIANYLNKSSSVNYFLHVNSLSTNGKNTNTVNQLQNDIYSLTVSNDAIENIQLFSKENQMLLDSSHTVIDLKRYYNYLFAIENITYDEWYHQILMEPHNWDSRFRSLPVKQNGKTLQSLFSAVIFRSTPVRTAPAVFLLFLIKRIYFNTSIEWNIHKMVLSISKIKTVKFSVKTIALPKAISICLLTNSNQIMGLSQKNSRSSAFSDLL